MTIALVLTASYMVAEVIGGIVSGSLALLADAGHMLSDAAALALALFAMWMARRPAKAQRTYGFKRSEILAALANGATLVAVAIFIFIEAYERFAEPPRVQGVLMLCIAVGGLVMNIIALIVLSGGRSESLNVRGAWLHVLSDALGSVGAIASGALIWAFGWYWADPVASVIIGLLVVHSAWSLLKETVAVLMEHAPGHINVDEVRESMGGHEHVCAVHDLHVWTITSGLVCLSAHVVTAAESGQQQTMLGELTSELRTRFSIDHVTIQIEHEEYQLDNCGCDTAEESAA